MWTDLDEEAVSGEEQMEEEDPFELFGRFLLDKSKGLWRRVSQKGTAVDKGTEVQGAKTSEKKPQGIQRSDGTRTGSVEEPPTPASEPESEPEPGSVWEEEVGAANTQRNQSVNPDSRASGSSDIGNGKPEAMDRKTLVKAR
jgi:hypothetical protein